MKIQILLVLGALWATQPIPPVAAQQAQRTIAESRPKGAVLARQYKMRVLPGGAVEISTNGVPAQVFHPRFTVLSRSDDPDIKSVRDDETAFKVPSWNSAGAAGRTSDYFAAGSATRIEAQKAVEDGGRVRWIFAPSAAFDFSAEVELPGGQEPPRIRWRFTPRRAGWYSVGYSGAPEAAPDAVESIWQPLVWQERRFPRVSFLSMEQMCPLPATLVSRANSTVGVAADPAEVPFRLPRFQNARFGVLVRNAEGKAQPLIFAPVLGLPDSRMEAGHGFEFRLRLLARPGGWFESYRDWSRELFGFRDYRENATCSLNQTLENMIDFEMDDQYSGWVPDLKAFDYTTDVPGTVKLVSALHPLSIALITDSREIYRRRALPMIEYMMSRQKYLFSVRPDITRQSPSHLMKGPCAEVSELAALHLMMQKRSPVFRHYAEELYGKPRVLNLDMVSAAGSWQNALALYRMSGDRSYLAKAEDGAKEYIRRRVDTAQTEFSDVHVETGGQFWTDFAPKWIDLFELYESTGNKQDLAAALAGATLYSAYAWMQPRPPDGDFLANKDGLAEHNNPRSMRAPEQTVPAWRVAQSGLTPEASTTYEGNAGVLLTHYAAYMLRVARETGESFLRDLARAAVVGRYSNFPGYCITREYTTVYQRPDYPLRPWRELTYNPIYYNHVWPHIALLMDYLISDAVTRSAGDIDFPPEYAEGYAYLKSKVYGDRPGSFYGDKSVYLWMPRKLLSTDQIQANYVAGYGNGNFYLALMNQCGRPLDVRVDLNPDVIPVNVDRVYTVRTWRQNRLAETVRLEHGSVRVPVAANGITALAVDGLAVSPSFQQMVFDNGARPLSGESYAAADSPLGKITGMLISMGASLTNAYVWLEATDERLKQARLHYEEAGQWKEVEDPAYPFEFSQPLDENTAVFRYWVEGVRPNGEKVRSGVVELKR